MSRVYVTGGTGFVGSNVVKVFGERHGDEVFVPVHRWRPDAAAPFEWAPVDLVGERQVRSSVLAFRPDVIVHAAILNDFGLLYRDRGLAWDAYVTTTRNLALAANDVGAKLVLVSTDWVFDGTQHEADETTSPNPVNYYGVLKLASEVVAGEVGDDVAVARISGVNGVHWLRPDLPRGQDCGFGYFVLALVETLRRGEPFTVWVGDGVNLVATPSLASECAEQFRRIIDGDHRGIFHCCGGETVDRLGLAELAAEVFELDASLLRTGPVPPEARLPAPVPVDTSLSAARTAEALGVELLGARRLLERFRAELESVLG